MTTASIPMNPKLNILLKASRGYQIIDVRAIVLIEADERYSRMVSTDGSQQNIFHTLTDMERILCAGKRMCDLLFLRIHKSHIIALHHTLSIGMDRTFTLSSGHRVGVGRQYWSSMLTHGMSLGNF